MKNFSLRITNLTLRAITILLKFILSVLVIKKLSVGDYGVFGLFQSTIIIATFIIGFDFYTYSSREILKKEAKPFSFYFTNQLVFYLLTYVLFIPFTYFFTDFGIIEFDHYLLFILILISEHLSQELYRILILLNKTVAATLILFLRSGLWIIALYVFWNRDIIDVNITSILKLWLGGALLSVLVGFGFLNLRVEFNVNLKWILTGIKISFPFFVGSVLYKCIEFSGRYFLKFYYTELEVGIFTFFTSIANILFVFVQTLVIIEIYPKLLESKGVSNKVFLKVFEIFKKQIKQYSAIGFILSLILIYPLLWFLDKTILLEYMISYIILLVSTLLFCWSFIYHYALYSYKKDTEILKSTIIGFIFNIIFSFVLIPYFGVLGASISQLLSFLIMLTIKFRYWKKYKL